MGVMNDDNGEKESDDWWEITIQNNKIDAKNSKNTSTERD